jgi:hypothetical protein
MFHAMHHPRPAEETSSAAVQTLALRARAGRLVIYVGAGVSAAEPAALPVGPALAERASEWLEGRLAGLGSYDDKNLMDLADTVEQQPGGRELLQEALIELAEFGEADVNYAHRALALLMTEGAVHVLTTNWDDCIERGAPVGTRLQVIVNDGDFASIRGPAVLKVHGCASRRGSLLVSTTDLARPPLGHHRPCAALSYVDHRLPRHR